MFVGNAAKATVHKLVVETLSANNAAPSSSSSSQLQLSLSCRNSHPRRVALQALFLHKIPKYPQLCSELLRAFNKEAGP